MGRWANPSSPHAEGRAARAALEEARARIAAAHRWHGDVILTSGTSEALAIALGRSAATRRIITAIEHDAVIRAAGDAALLPVDAVGQPVAEELDRLLRPGGRPLVAVQWANSETGVRQPIGALAEAIHAAGGLLLVDAAQMPAHADPTLADHADFVALSSHKRGGPPGMGALLIRDLALLAPTGGQERGYRPGTENVPGALGYAAALDEPEPIERWAALRTMMEEEIVAAGGEVVAGRQHRHPAIGSYRMPDVTAVAQLIRFDLAGLAVSAGSACSSGSLKPSHVLAAMGWDETASREVIRISFGRATTADEVTRCAAVWREIARTARTRAA